MNSFVRYAFQRCPFDYTKFESCYLLLNHFSIINLFDKFHPDFFLFVETFPKKSILKRSFQRSTKCLWMLVPVWSRMRYHNHFRDRVGARKNVFGSTAYEFKKDFGNFGFSLHSLILIVSFFITFKITYIRCYISYVAFRHFFRLPACQITTRSQWLEPVILPGSFNISSCTKCLPTNLQLDFDACLSRVIQLHL